MSRNGALVRLDDDDLAWLRAYDPARPEASGADRTAGWFFSEHPGAYELERAYLPVHYLLTGSVRGGQGPASFLRNARIGQPVGYPFAHGPGRILAPGEVDEIAAAIESLNAGEVRRRLDSDALRNVAPFAMRALSDEDKEWLLAVLQGLMTYMRAAADDGASLLVAVV